MASLDRAARAHGPTSGTPRPPGARASGLTGSRPSPSLGAMASGARVVRVFVSSTSEDLKDHRAVARNVIMDLGWQPKMMEHFGSSPHATVVACREELGRCDLMLLVVAWRRGWVPTPQQGGDGTESITAMELRHARERGIPVLPLFASETWPGNLWEDDADARVWMKSFRQNLNQPAVFFDYEPLTAQETERLPAFRAKVKEALLAEKERLLARVGGGQGAPELDYFESARDGLCDGTDVPFVGPGVYGDGPLGREALMDALAGEDVGEEVQSIATAAEYRERYLGSREHLLRHLARLLSEQTARTEPLPIHDLLVGLERLPLVVSTCSDEVLENRLREAGRPFVLVSHVVRSYSGEHDGKVVVVPPEGEPRFLPADELTLDEACTVVYKPVGSPYLNDRLDEDGEIDTVMITETDHVAFLQRLDNERTGVPKRFAIKFARRPLLFLGYALDVWQYRLMMHVFQSAHRQARRSTTIAVRRPGSVIEQLAWKRLNADLVPMDPNEFARAVLGGAAAR